MTRRKMGWILGTLGASSAHAQTSKPGTSIHQEVDFKATPARIYEALVDAKQFGAFTKDTAEIPAGPGSAFKLFGGRIEGRNIELVPNQRIVQAWRPVDWPAGVYTMVRFELSARGAGTRLVFDQTGFIEDAAEWKHLNEGWPKMYWEPLRNYLNA